MTARRSSRAVPGYCFICTDSEKSGVWEAWGCHRSRDIGSAADDLLFLRKLPVSARQNRLSGETEVYENAVPGGFRRVGVLPGVRVTAEKEGGAPLNTFTNADGVYEFYDLPPGDYVLMPSPLS